MEFTWKITFIWSTEQVGQNNTDKRTFCVEEVWKEYPSSIAIDVRKEKCMELNTYGVWDEVKLQLNSKAKEYNGRHFNSISAWKITKTSWEVNNVSEDNPLPF